MKCWLWLTESTLSQKCVYKRYKHFTEGREDVDDDEHPEGTTTSTSEENIETVKIIVLENRRIIMPLNFLLCSEIAKFWLKGRTVNKEYYKEVMQRLR